MKGLYPISLRASTAARATVGMQVIPRLPTPTAIRPPALTRSRSRLSRMSRRTVPATSATWGWGIDWQTRASGGTDIGRDPWEDAAGAYLGPPGRSTLGPAGGPVNVDEG